MAWSDIVVILQPITFLELESGLPPPLFSGIGEYASPSSSVFQIRYVLVEWVRVVLEEVIICITLAPASSIVLGVIFVYDLCQGVWPRCPLAAALWWVVYHMIAVKHSVVFIRVI